MENVSPSDLDRAKANAFQWHSDADLFQRWIKLQYQDDTKRGENTRLVDILESPAIFGQYNVVYVLLISPSEMKVPVYANKFCNPSLDTLLDSLGYGASRSIYIDQAGDYWLESGVFNNLTLRDLYTFLEASCVSDVVIELVKKK